MVERTGLDTIGGRAKAVRLERKLAQQEIADALDISLRAWQKMERDEGTPSGETLLQFQKIGINPGWVLSGAGPKFDGSSITAEPSIGVDIVLLQKLHDTVQAVFIECKQTAPPRAVTAEAGELYNQLLGMVSDIRDKAVVTALIPVLRERFKERVASAKPGSGKHSAS